MLRFDKPKLEGPALAIVGSAIGGWLGAGTAVGAVGGSIIGGLAGSALAGSMTKTPSIPTMAAPQIPGAPTQPQTPALSEPQPSAGAGSAATEASIAKGELESMKRRGRLSTILSSRRTGDEDIERLGG